MSEPLTKDERAVAFVGWIYDKADPAMRLVLRRYEATVVALEVELAAIYDAYAEWATSAESPDPDACSFQYARLASLIQDARPLSGERDPHE